MHLSSFLGVVTCAPLRDAWERLAPDLEAIVAELPEGTTVDDVRHSFSTQRKLGTFGRGILT